MLRVCLLFFSIFQLIHASCPPNFDLVRDGQCRGEQSANVKMQHNEALDIIVQKCGELYGQPIIIHNDEEWNYWMNVKDPNGKSPTYAWPIGLTCNIASKRWEWTDGSALDFKAPSWDDLDGACSTDSIWLMYPAGEWALFGGSNTWTPNIYCTTQLRQPRPTANCGGNFEREDADDICYEVVEDAETWQDAQMTCRSIDSYLASIHNAQENAFLRRLAVSRGAVSGLYLGATMSGKGDSYGWIDGSPWDYQNFHPGFPMDGFGDCLAMDTSNTAGEWLNRDCSSKLPVACVRHDFNITGKDNTCSTDKWKEGDVVTSPGYPFNASVPCEFFLSVEQGKMIEATIISLEANSCCDSLTIYDDYLGGKLIANVTGNIVNATYTSNTNFMKVTWQPDGGVNVKGLAMVFRGI